MADEQGDLRLIYEGTDITDSVDVLECTLKDTCGSMSDILDLKLDHARSWFQWQPQRNDVIRVKRGGYDSGALYLNTIAPEDGAYRIYATGIRCLDRPKKWQAFEDSSFAEILLVCASELGMDWAGYGLKDIRYDYMLRQNESATAFLARICALEGIALKAGCGKITAIDITEAQKIKASHLIKIDSELSGSRYTRISGLRISALRIETPYGSGEAEDTEGEGQRRTISDLPAGDEATARRWARGLLLTLNRQFETLETDTEFNPGYSAMVRVDAEGGTDADGEWIIDEAEHDLREGRTRARMLRVVDSVV